MIDISFLDMKTNAFILNDKLNVLFTNYKQQKVYIYLNIYKVKLHAGLVAVCLKLAVLVSGIFVLLGRKK